jgi:hypothetical protein
MEEKFVTPFLIHVSEDKQEPEPIVKDGMKSY